MKKTLKGFVMALALVVGAAGVTTVTTSIATAPPAAAFGWSDIKKTAGKAGGAIKKGTVKAGKGIKTGAKWVGKQANKSDLVKGATKDIRKVGSGVKKGAKWVGKQANKSAVVRGVVKDVKAVGSGIKNVAGKLRATAKVPESRKLLDLRRALNAKGLIPKRRTPYPGSRSGRTMKIGIVQDKAFHGVGKKPLGRDKSVWGRPVGTKKPQRVQGIRSKDIKSKKQAHRPVTGRDKSVWGRPVGTKRHHKLNRLQNQLKEAKRARGKSRMRVNTRGANKRFVLKRKNSRKGNRFEKRKRRNGGRRR